MGNVIWFGFILIMVSFVAIFTNTKVLEKKQELKTDDNVLYKVVRYNLIVGITAILIAASFNTTMLFIFILAYIAIHIQYYLYLFYRKYFVLGSIALGLCLLVVFLLTVPSTL